MPPVSNRPGSSYRPTPRPGPSGYNRRANSTRRDIRMDNKRRGSNSPNWRLLLILAAVVILVVVVIGIIASVSNRSQQPAPTPQTTPQNTQDTTPPPVTSDPPVDTTPPTAPPDTTAPSEGGLAYTDDRVPSYAGTNPVWETMRFEWDRQDNLGSIWIEIPVDREMYLHYKNLERYQGIENYKNYINDPNNRALIRQIVDTIRSVTDDLSYSDSAMVRELAKFTQDVIEYQYDSDTTGEDEYPRYPIETLYEGQGDCEDTSILMAALLKELGYDVGFLHVPGHIAVALRTSDDYSGGSYYEINGHRYLFIESTGSGWNIGDIPEDYQNVSATFYDLS